MLMKAQILERFVSGVNRFFKVNLYSRQTVQPVQFHSGGDDYNPPASCEGLAGTIGENPANSVVLAWRDNIERKSRPGEKRIYAVNTTDGNVSAELFLRNDGVIEITGGSNLVIVTGGNVNLTSTGDTNISAANVVISASNATVNADAVNLGGDGGALVLTENSEIKDGEGRPCTITSNTSKTKAV